MRRKERQVTSKEEIIEILDKCRVCRLSLHDESGNYIVPMSYGYDFDEDLIIYLHGAKKGRRADILLNGDTELAFEIDHAGDFIADKEKMFFTVKYSCIMGNGVCKILDSYEEKSYAINKILNHQMDMLVEIPEKVLDATMVFTLNVKNYTCKKN